MLILGHKTLNTRLIYIPITMLTLAACQQSSMAPPTLGDANYQNSKSKDNSEPKEIPNQIGGQGNLGNLASLTHVINTNPNDASALNLRGTAYGRAKSYDKALNDFNHALKIKPNYYQAMVNRALIYVKIQKYHLAEQDYNATLNINPNYGIAYIGRGNLHAINKKYHIAIADFTRAINLQGDDAIAWFSRGKSYQSLGQHQQALRDLDQTIALKPISSEPYFRRGLTHMKLSHLKKAYQDFLVASRRDTNHYAAWTYRGLAAEQLGKKKKAAFAYKHALRIKSDFKPAKEGLHRVGNV